MENKLKQLPFNTITVYFAPFFFSQPRDLFLKPDFRIVIGDEFFDDNGYLRKNLSIKQLLSKTFFVSEITTLLNLEEMLRTRADIYLSQDRYIILKMQPFRIPLSASELTEMQNIVNLKTSSLSRGAKKRVQQFWRDMRVPAVLFKVSDELYPTENVKLRLASELGIDMSILQDMQDITEAIKWHTDSLSAVLKVLDIPFKQKIF